MLPAFLLVVAFAAETEAGAPADGQLLFARHCAVCHDADGRAQSALAKRLRPRPRDFGEGLFQLASSDDGRATRADLERVVVNGIPGSGMPSFRQLPATELAAVVDEVERLTVAGVAIRMKEDARYFGEELDDELANRFARSALEVGPLPPLPPFPPATAETLRIGREHYVVHCAACHGFDGRGRGEMPAWSDPEFPLARDLTRGLLKGGSSREDLARRIRAGMPGRGMPPTRLDPAATGALTVYVESLLPTDVATRFHQQRERVVAKRVSATAKSPLDPAWNDCESRRLVLSPLSGRPDAALEAHLAAMHDGGTIALRLSFPDPTRDDRALARSKLPDACAIQFSADVDPPLFGMGSKHHETTMWHWRAFRPDRIAGLFELLAAPSDHSIAPPEGLFAPETKASEYEVGSPADSAAASAPGAVEVSAEWAATGWSVVFRRALQPDPATPGAPRFAPGSKLGCAIAVWNGSAGDHRERKSISLWNELVIED
jgi:DMSO reductase family type II enzyme heme b subunit